MLNAMVLVATFALVLFVMTAILARVMFGALQRAQAAQDRLEDRFDHLGAELTRLEHMIRQQRTLVERLCDLQAIDARLDQPEWRT
jgi:cell shape-determining protein MreC